MRRKIVELQLAKFPLQQLKNTVVRALKETTTGISNTPWGPCGPSAPVLPNVEKKIRKNKNQYQTKPKFKGVFVGTAHFKTHNYVIRRLFTLYVSDMFAIMIHINSNFSSSNINYLQ